MYNKCISFEMECEIVNKITKIIVALMVILIVGYICVNLVKNDTTSVKEMESNETNTDIVSLYDYTIESGENDILLIAKRKW